MTNKQPTPETDAHQLKPEMAYDRLWSDFARKLERERDEAREALSGRTVSCSRCNEAGYKLAGFEAEVAGLRAENEDLRDEARNALRLASENESLQAHLDELTASTIHSCGDHCQRPNCVRRREMAAMREAIREAALALAYVSNFEECRIFCADSMDIDSHAAPMCTEAIDKLKPFITAP